MSFTKSSVFSGARAIFGGGKIINLKAAANGNWFDTLDKQAYYKNRASQPTVPHTYTLSNLGVVRQDVGGIFRPKEASLMPGDKLFRLVGKVEKSMSSKDIFRGKTGEWFGPPSVFESARDAAKKMAIQDFQLFERESEDGVFLDLLRYYQGLGYKYNLTDSRIIEYRVTAPLIALFGHGRIITENYAPSGLSFVGQYQPSPQIFVVGYTDADGNKNIPLIEESLEITDINDAISYLKGKE